MTTIMYMLISVAIFLAARIELSVANDDIIAVNRMVNGVDAYMSEFPFVVSVQINGIHTCSGTILNENWILTAAHCFIRHPDVSRVIIQAGTRKLDEGGIKKHVERVIITPNYNASQSKVNYDCALVKLASRLSFNQPHIGMITTPQQGDKLPNPGTTVTAVGYGKYSEDGNSGKPLKKIELKTLSASDCPHYPNLHICAHDPQKYQCPCFGDSGGPLLVNGIQFGIYSGGPKPCACDNIIFFTRTALCGDWIATNIAS